MKKLFLFILVLCCISLLHAEHVAAVQACTHWMSQGGSGSNNCPQGTPCTVARFISIAAPGNVGCLTGAAGSTTVYSGANSMITISGKNGTAFQPITIRAENDGAVVITGRDDGVLQGHTGSCDPVTLVCTGIQNDRQPAYLYQSAYWIFEGFDMCCGSGNGAFWLSRDSNYTIVRRVVGWDGTNIVTPNSSQADSDIFSSNDNTGNLFEDVAGFGSARKIFSNAQGGDNVTYRRVWGMWSNHGTWETFTGSPKYVSTIAYNSYNGIYENAIGTWDAVNPNTGSSTSIFANDHMDNSPPATCTGYNFATGQYDPTFRAKYLGSIAYHKTGQTTGNSGLGLLASLQTIDCMEFKDVVAYSQNASFKPLSMDDYSSNACSLQPGGVCTHLLTNVTSIGPASDAIQSQWTRSNYVHSASFNSTLSPFQTTTGTGARVCYRYQNGVLQNGQGGTTATPLWPWPMDARINQALTRSGRTPANVFAGSAGTGYAANTVTSQMVALFGAIPAGCMQGVAPPVVTVTITSPTSSPTYTHNQSTITLGGTSSLP